MADGAPLDYATPLAAAIDIFDTARKVALPEPLATVASSAVDFRRSIGRLGRHGLAQMNDGTTGPRVLPPDRHPAGRDPRLGLGSNHPDTLVSERNLAIDLRKLGVG